MEPSNVPRGAWRAFERGPRSCIGREMAMEVMRIALLLTLREFDFGCASVTRTDTPITSFTDLDMQIGDLAFQEQALSAKPRGGTMMKVTAV